MVSSVSHWLKYTGRMLPESFNYPPFNHFRYTANKALHIIFHCWKVSLDWCSNQICHPTRHRRSLAGNFTLTVSLLSVNKSIRAVPFTPRHPRSYFTFFSNKFARTNRRTRRQSIPHSFQDRFVRSGRWWTCCGMIRRRSLYQGYHKDEKKEQKAKKIHYSK